MSIKEGLATKRKSEKMSDISFRLMALTFNVINFLYPYVKKRVNRFGISESMTIIDYGCGPGRYSIKFAELVGKIGMV